MTSTAKKLIATTALSFASLAGFAGIAGAETFGPAPQQGPGPIIAIPAPQPEPDPPAPEPQLPIAQPEGGTDPAPDLPIAQPEPEEDPQPADLPIAQPEADEDPEPQPEPQFPTDGEIAVDPCTVVTHGCGEDDGSIDDLTSADDGCTVIIGGPEVCPDDTPEETPGDEPGDEPGDTPEDTPADEPGTRGGSLPRTGAGIALLAGLGTALTAAGAAARKLAKR